MAGGKHVLIECSYFLVEGAPTVNKKTGLLSVPGIFGRVDEGNRNSRMYATEEYVREIERTRPLVEARGMYGELDHPEDLQVHLQNVSHIITDLRLENKDIKGTLEVLPTPKGKILEALLLSKGQVGISSRGTGDFEGTTTEGLQKVVNFELITFDAVAEPSASKSYLQQLGESIERRTAHLRKEPKESGLGVERDLARAIESIIQSHLGGGR